MTSNARRWIIGAVAAAILLRFLLVWTPLLDSNLNRWVRSDSLPERVDAAVVLSGGIHADGLLKGSSADRLLSGIELVRRGVAPKIVTSTEIKHVKGERISGRDDQRRLIGIAQLENEWIVLDSVASTADEARRAATILLPLGIRSVALVTEPMHTRRACAAFERAGFRVYCVPARERTHRTWGDLNANDRARALRLYAYERLAVWKYQRNGWI